MSDEQAVKRPEFSLKVGYYRQEDLERMGPEKLRRLAELAERQAVAHETGSNPDALEYWSLLAVAADEFSRFNEE